MDVSCAWISSAETHNIPRSQLCRASLGCLCVLDHIDPLLFSGSSFDLYRNTNGVGITPTSMCGNTIYAQSSHLRHCNTLIHIPLACGSPKHVACHLAQAADAFFSNQSPRSDIQEALHSGNIILFLSSKNDSNFNSLW